MKRSLRVICLLIACICLFQPQQTKAQSGMGGINYQAVVRNASGTAVPNQPIKIRFSVLDNSPGGQVQYQETHDLTTNQLGLFTTQIGTGTPTTGTFAAIPWANTNQYLRVEVAINGGSYSELGTTQLFAVPYALYAANAGSPGPRGLQGVQGIQGLKGDVGATGPAGPAGPAGPQGLQGLQGPAGIAGLAGPKGEPGQAGPAGPSGPIGPQGPQGEQGLTGPQGMIGFTGGTGATGPIGPQGIKGDDGIQGPMGPTGLAGPKGDQGDPGPAGAAGIQGPAGPTGPAGPIGATGIAGPVGPAGPAGATGPQGVPGPMGLIGPMGPIGPIGPIGPAGATGATGPVGPTGAIGPQGPIGPVGPAGSLTGAAGGDLTGTYPNPQVAGIRGINVSPTPPVNGQGLIYDGTNWIPGNLTGDNLGNHIATMDIQLRGFKLTNQPTNTGINLTDAGKLTLTTNPGSLGPTATTFVVDDFGGMYATGKKSIGTIPTTGAGEHMIWYPGKGSFRAGTAVTNEWDDANTGLNSTAFGTNVLASGFASIAAGDAIRSSGYASVALGRANEASGSGAVAIGTRCYAPKLSAVALGDTVAADGDYSVALGKAAKNAGYNGCMIMGDNSSGLDVVVNTAANQFVARYAGGYILYTQPTSGGSAGVGGVLAPGSSSWSAVSDSTKKEKFALADGEEFLEKLNQLRLGSWNYKTYSPAQYRHYGPFAQEIFAAFGTDKYGKIGCDTLINSGDMDGIMLIMLQALNKRCEALQVANKKLVSQVTDLATLRKENEELKAALSKVEALTQRLMQLEATVKSSAGDQPKTTASNINQTH